MNSPKALKNRQEKKKEEKYRTIFPLFSAVFLSPYPKGDLDVSRLITEISQQSAIITDHFLGAGDKHTDKKITI